MLEPLFHCKRSFRSKLPRQKLSLHRLRFFLCSIIESVVISFRKEGSSRGVIADNGDRPKKVSKGTAILRTLP